MRQPVFPALAAVLLGASVFAPPARGQEPAPASTMTEVTVPGGIRGAVAALGDAGPVDRGQMLLDVIRRAHESPMGLKGTGSRRDAVLRPLLAYLDGTAPATRAAGISPQPARPGATDLDTIPLPLSPSIWIDVILGGKSSAATLVADILRSPGAALTYSGLLSLDDATRAWIGTQPDLLAEIVTRHAPAFVVAAAALRVDGTQLVVPGGAAARPMWEAIVGRPSDQPAAFVRALLADREGRLAYFFSSFAALTPAQLTFALALDRPEGTARVDAGRRLYLVYQRIAEGWNMDDRPFWRPSFDPALLVADLAATGGKPSLAGGRAFWTAVFDENGSARAAAAAVAQPSQSEPLEFVWLAEQVFRGSHASQRPPYYAVLFASRLVKDVTVANAADALTAVRGVGSYPALVTSLERARIADISTYAKVASRAAHLSEAGQRAVRAVAEFSGALAFLTRAVGRGGLTPAAASAAMSSLADIEPDARGEYEGRVVLWLQGLLDKDTTAAPEIARGTAPGVPDAAEATDAVYHDALSTLDRRALRLLAGGSRGERRSVEWEGTQYHLDFVRAEVIRLTRVLGNEPRPYLSSAMAAIEVAGALSQARSKDLLQRQADASARIDTALRCSDKDPWEFSDALTTCRDLHTALQRAAKSGDASAAKRLIPRFRALADDLVARGFVELAYAVALGQPDASPISASEAASRHDFGLEALGFGASGPWRVPGAGADRTHDWHVTGSLLGLDVRLAQYAVVPLSSKPPSLRPTINDEDRRIVVESAALLEPQRLTDDSLKGIARALAEGRKRVAAIQTSADAEAIAIAVPLAAARRTVFAWLAVHDRDRLATFLSPTELLWLGGADTSALGDWGISGESRLGCLCLQVAAPGALERLSGRWYSGIFATGFADLHLRLAELLTELAMPAPLLAPVMASASLDFVTTVRFRDADDRRGLVDYVHSLRVDNLEQYLGLLTTDGPLVPIGDGTGHTRAGHFSGSFVPLH